MTVLAAEVAGLAGEAIAEWEVRPNPPGEATLGDG